MGLSTSQRNEIESLLTWKIREKLVGYFPETTNMPFHVRLLGKDRMALFSFVQSINTTLGMSVFEQVAEVIARPHFKSVSYQYKDFNNTISEDAQLEITRIMNSLSTAQKTPDKLAEISAILAVAQTGTIINVRQPRIDLFLESHDGTEYYFDLKTAKPNMGDIAGLKRTLLNWVAIRGVIDSRQNIFTGLAIPYNPYEPDPYNRWTFAGMFDLPNELKVAGEFWDFLGGEHSYEDLLDVFEKVGIELRSEIDTKFLGFASK